MKKLLIIILFISTALYAEEKVSIAILDLMPQGKISRATAAGATYFVRSYIGKHKSFILHKDTVHTKKKCITRRCAVTIGKKLNVQKVIIGTIAKKRKLTVINIKLVNVKKGVFEFSTTIKFEPEAAMDKSIKEITDRVFDTIVNKVHSPQYINASIGKEQIVLNWKKQKNNPTYYVYKSTSSKDGFKKIGKTSGNNFTDTTTEPGRKYYYKVQTSNDDGYSLLSSPVMGISALSKTGYYVRSIVPGYGQIYYGNTTKGYLFLGGFFLSCAVTGITYKNYLNKKDAYNSYNSYNGYPAYPGDTSYQDEADKRYTDYKTATNLFLFSAVVTGLVYVAHWLDVFVWNEPYYINKTATTKSSLFFKVNRYADTYAYNTYITEASIGLRF